MKDTNIYKERCCGSYLSLFFLIFFYSLNGFAEPLSPSPPASVQNPKTKTGIILTLKVALSAAQENFEQAKISQTQYQQEALTVEKAWAAFMPYLAIRGNLTRNNQEVSFDNRTLQQYYSMAGNLTLSATLFRGSAISKVMEAYPGREAAAKEARWRERQLAFKVTKSYLACLAAENYLTAARESLKVADEHLQAAKLRNMAGQALQIDVQRAEIKLLSANNQADAAQSNLAESMDYLSFLTDQPQPFRVEEPELPAKTVLDPKNQRPDLDAVSLKIKSARRGLQNQWLDYLPSLTMNGNYRYSQTQGWTGENFRWDLILSLEWVLYNGGQRSLDKNQRSLGIKKLLLERRLLERGIQQEIRRTLRHIDTAQRAVGTNKRKLHLARQNRELVLARYRAGLATYLELLEAGEDSKQAEIEIVSSRLGLSLKKLDLLKALGLNPMAD